MATLEVTPPAAPVDPFQQGYLPTDFPLTPLGGVGAVLGQSWRAYWREFPTIAMLVLTVFGPVEAVKSFFLHSTHQQDNLWLAVRIEMWTGGIFGALLTPAVIFAVMWRLRNRSEPAIGASLRWGVRHWARTFGYRFVAGLAMFIGLILLIVPGILIAILFSLVGPVVAVESNTQSSVLGRSRKLARLHPWIILGAGVAAFALFVVLSLGVGLVYGVLSYFADHWILSAAVDCVLDMGFAFFDVMLLCIYLGIIVQKEAADLPPGSLGLSPPYDGSSLLPGPPA